MGDEWVARGGLGRELSDIYSIYIYIYLGSSCMSRGAWTQWRDARHTVYM